MLTHFLITIHLLSSSFKKLQEKEFRIPKTDTKNRYQKSVSMSSKKYTFLSSLRIFRRLLLLRFGLLGGLLGLGVFHPARFRTARHGFTTSVSILG